MDASGFATAYGLSTSVGLRPFLTLALASLAMHLGYLHPSAGFAYLGTDGATWLLAALAGLEFLSDKVPVVDNVLHGVHFATKPIVAALLVGSTLPGSPEAGTYAVMGLAALNALGVHTGVAAARGASTAMTLGMANPVVSILEDGAALGTTLLALALPFVGAGLAVALTLVLFIVARQVYRQLRRPRSGATLTR